MKDDSTDDATMPPEPSDWYLSVYQTDGGSAPVDDAEVVGSADDPDGVDEADAPPTETADKKRSMPFWMEAITSAP